MSQTATRMRDRRRLSAIPGGSHDRWVRLLALVLPAGVGVIAAVMILAPLSPRGEISFLLDRHKVQTTNERIHVTAATYRGLDNQQRPFAISAGSADQASSSVPVVNLHDLVAQIELPEGAARLSAQGGNYNYSTQRVGVIGPVNFTAADGYRLSAINVSIDLRARRVSGSGGISGAIPAGTFSANSIDADLGARSVTLVGNARLHMAPGQLRMP
jgi:lipopolysaccharide export system protein LptC